MIYMNKSKDIIITTEDEMVKFKDLMKYALIETQKNPSEAIIKELKKMIARKIVNIDEEYIKLEYGENYKNKVQFSVYSKERPSIILMPKEGNHKSQMLETYKFKTDDFQESIEPLQYSEFAYKLAKSVAIKYYLGFKFADDLKAVSLMADDDIHIESILAQLETSNKMLDTNKGLNLLVHLVGKLETLPQEYEARVQEQLKNLI